MSKFQDFHALGPLPAGWTWVRLEQLLDSIEAGKSFAADSTPPERDQVGIVKVSAVTWGTYDETETKTVHDPMLVNPKLFVRPGDLLFSRANTIDLVGAVVLVERVTRNIMLSDKILRLCMPERFKKWTLWALRSQLGRKQIELLATGNQDSMRNIGQERIRQIAIPLPPLVEQHQIVAAIEAHFSRLDATEASLTRAKANVKRARASVLKAAVEGRLVPNEAALARAEGRDYEPASATLARISQPPRPNRYKTRSTDIVPGHAALSVGDAGISLPEGWARSAMVDVARMESGHTPSRTRPEWWSGDIPWIGIADARQHHGGIIHDTFQHTNAEGLENSAARLLPEGTVCVSRTASVGYVVVMGRAMATSQDFVNWVCTEALAPHWVRIVFLADREALLRFGKGSVHKTIYFPELLSLNIAIPPLAEQQRIVAEVDRRLSMLGALDATLDASLARCAKLRQSILKRAFEGRLVPPDAPKSKSNVPQIPLFTEEATV